MATSEYRKRKGDDKHPWHFCWNCKDWPVEHYETSTRETRPVCSQCLALQRRQMCTRGDTYV